MKVDIREKVYERYIKPTEEDRKDYVGVEIELPIVNISGLETNHEVCRQVFEQAVKKFEFKPESYDDNGKCHSATNQKTEDILSFDCSYNNLEISFGKEKNLLEVEKRLKGYLKFFNEKLEKENHIITGMGINPFYKKCRKDYLPNGRYKMLEGYLKKYKEWQGAAGFHPYPEFGTFASSTQLQLDIKKEELIETLKVFSCLEPIKSLLFANSLMLEDQPNNLLNRDDLWEFSSHGINPRNIGGFERLPQTIEEMIDYISYTSIFCNEREKKYPFFYPIAISEYFEKESIDAWSYREDKLEKIKLHPQIEDLSYLRTYKFLDLTARGTIEYRSLCTQPLNQSLMAVALQVGLSKKGKELEEILLKDSILYGHSFSENELRKLFNKDYIPNYIKRDELSNLIIKIIDLGKEGLKERGYGEEKFLEELYDRAYSFESPARKMRDGIRAGIKIQEFIYDYAEIA